MSQAPNSLQARDKAYVVHPYTNLRAHEQQGPLVITRGEGIWVWDDDGKAYIEGLSGLWCASLGFSEKRLVEAARRQMERLPYTHVFAHRSSEPVIELAEKLVSIAPQPIAKAFFVNSGSEAIDTAIKLIWYYNNARGKPEKKRILARKRAYHGITLAGGHLTGLAYARTGFDLPMSDRFFHLTCPSHYRDALPGESEGVFASRLVEELDTLIRALGPETIAAFFAEPVMGAGGVVVPPKGYFEKIQPILKKHDILFVADEVINGFCRTGNMWGCDTFGIRPDLVICAKQLSSAYVPIAAVLMSQEFYEVIADQSAKLGTLGMGYTYSGHPVAAAVALETLRIYESDKILDHVRRVSPRFQERLIRLAAHPLVGEARGVGLLGGLEIVKDKKTKEQFPQEAKAAAQIVQRCLEEGLIVRPLPGDVIGICPPLIIEEHEIDQLFDRLERGLDAALPAMPKAA
ncbi:MAG: aminotransferase class III-fold pyridoxal phosphate-dependent enzyme [Geminicoccaceae bacterium]|nr:aminotransferase class III-fold pyridoxal phosphate-dependent enzyme [Geminicoccaceae bacterium]